MARHNFFLRFHPTKLISKPATPTAAMPTGTYYASDGTSYTPIWSNDFLTNVAVGGDLTTYGQYFAGEDGTKTTSNGSGTYRPSKVLSVANSNLHWALGYNSTTGEYQCAKPAPLSYQTYLYGSCEVRFKTNSSAGSNTLYKMAFLNWPGSNNWSDGEIDWAEADGLYSQFRLASVHLNTDADFLPNPKNYAGVASDGNYHTVRMEWTATYIKWYFDGTLYSTVTDTNYIPQVPMTVFLQVEPSIGLTPTTAETASVDLDWLVISQKN